MVAKGRKKKFTSGEGVRYITRNKALKKLQLSLKDFRRLCILKGIYPREPHNRHKAQKGQSGVKTLYHMKDIQFLMQEPIIWKLRDLKVYFRKIDKSRSIKEFGQMNRLIKKHPTLKLDNIVKERYPSFIDALGDLDDCLTLCFLFTTFPTAQYCNNKDLFMLCRRLTVEFMHAVIEAKALRKVFISIKGYYYQVEIKGVTITWIVPHQFGFQPQKREVDFKIMFTFAEFYVIMLGFVNYRLYNSLNLFYPPKLSIRNVTEVEKTLAHKEDLTSERIAALNLPLNKTIINAVEEAEIDDFPIETGSGEVEQARKEAQEVKKLQTLFKGLKFFLNREVPRESLVFIIRCCDGQVSWDKISFVGSTFDEDDETITHQIVDRPILGKQYISRYYVQPQWVFDSINARELLPVNKYFVGQILPPHLSPFVNKERDPVQQYIPPEEVLLNDPTAELPENKINEDDAEVEKTSDAEESENEEAEQMENNEVEQVTRQQLQRKKLSVKPGEVEQEDPRQKYKLERQEYYLREKMVKNKHRNLYRSMMEGKKKRSKEVWLLQKKRKRLNEKQADTN